MLGGNGCIEDATGNWHCTSMFHARLPCALRLNSMLSQTTRWVPANDKEAVESLKITLFRDCRNSKSEFVEMRCKESPRNEPIIYSSCECHYAECHHDNNMSYIAEESKQYYKDTCPSCVLKVDKPCNKFWNCCITRMRHEKALPPYNRPLHLPVSAFTLSMSVLTLNCVLRVMYMKIHVIT